ncbi:hypothetical protein Plhal304r1_c014g0051981 [Plasmopara halstedii]
MQFSKSVLLPVHYDPIDGIVDRGYSCRHYTHLVVKISIYRLWRLMHSTQLCILGCAVKLCHESISWRLWLAVSHFC